VVSHVALESDGAIQVFDVCEFQDEFNAFGETLMPGRTEAGVDLNPPMVAGVHNVIRGGTLAQLSTALVIPASPGWASLRSPAATPQWAQTVARSSK
jgi:hypothetical protein